PESGFDSVAITGALLYPVMTFMLQLYPLIPAITTGVLINRLPDDLQLDHLNEAEITGCGCPIQTEESYSSAQVESHFVRVRNGLTYSFGDLLGDIGKWLLIGIGAAGVIATLVPDDFFIRYLSNEFLSLLIMLGVGIPLYICASASTPVAAALVLKGLSPGAALVFLLAGPATNAATITVVSRYFGKKATLVYLLTVALCSLLFGWLTNLIYRWFDLDTSQWIDSFGDASDSLLMQLSAVVLLLLILKNIRLFRLH
ncbi:MAG: permease, partial [Desulfuromusa sp.]|nr:permease [Desulfuromusa sp.]